MTRKWRLAVLLGLLTILLGYLFVGNTMKHSKKCLRDDGYKKGMHMKKGDKQKVEKKKEVQTKKAKIGFMAGERDPISSIKKIGQDQSPEWYSYLLKKDYIDNEWSPTMNGMVMTRKSVTPYLLRYAQLNELELFENDSCQFDDISDESTQMQGMIETVCRYRLLRGKNGSYLKDDIMTQTDMLVLLMRSKWGYLNENTTPRFKNYYNQAVSQGIVKPGLDLSIFNEQLTVKDVSLWMQRMHKENDASVLIAQ